MRRPDLPPSARGRPRDAEVKNIPHLSILLGISRDVTGRKQAERQLQFQARVLSQVDDAVIAIDTGGRITYMNRAAERLYDTSWSEALGRLDSELFTYQWINPDDERNAWDALRSSGTWRGVVLHRKKGGEVIFVDETVSTLNDADGRSTRMLCSLRDVTAQRRAEKELRIKDMAIASSPSAFTIPGLNGRLTYVNQAFLSMWDYTSPSEVVGKPVKELWHDGKEAMTILQTLLETGRYTGERVGRRRDGSTFYTMFSGNVVTNDAGVPIGLAASLTDITDQKQAEAEVQAHNRALSVLNQIIGVSTSATDIDEVLESVLAGTLTLLDLAGGGIYLIEPGKQRARLVCTQGLPEGFPKQPCIPDITLAPYAKVLVEGEPLFCNDHPHLRYPGEGDGTPHPFASIPIIAHGKIVGALNVVPRESNGFADADRSLLTAIGREIGTSVERSMLIRQLEMAEREANLYLDILSHDIRNAENVSGLYTNLLVDMLDGETKGYAEKLRSSIRKSVEILRNVSTIRRIHHESAAIVPVDLDRVIRDEIAIFSGSRIHYGGTDLTVMADALLPEVFTNLIGNAIKFSGQAVEVTIRVEEHGDEVLVSVEDTGPGVPDEMKEAVFMRFGHSRNRKSGQGLGLYITRMLIERYGGRIRVDDRVPGRPECGAAFRFTLKRA